MIEFVQSASAHTVTNCQYFSTVMAVAKSVMRVARVPLRWNDIDDKLLWSLDGSDYG
jgi:hypothetical protein